MKGTSGVVIACALNATMPDAIRPIKERMESRGLQGRKSQAIVSPYSDPSHGRADPPEIPVRYRSALIAII
jgi:hypothetical protein